MFKGHFKVVSGFLSLRLFQGSFLCTAVIAATRALKTCCYFRYIDNKWLLNLFDSLYGAVGTTKELEIEVKEDGPSEASVPQDGLSV